MTIPIELATLIHTLQGRFEKIKLLTNGGREGSIVGRVNEEASKSLVLIAKVMNCKPEHESVVGTVAHEQAESGK